jgi:hypothetical protein
VWLLSYYIDRIEVAVVSSFEAPRTHFYFD